MNSDSDASFTAPSITINHTNLLPSFTQDLGEPDWDLNVTTDAIRAVHRNILEITRDDLFEQSVLREFIIRFDKIAHTKVGVFKRSAFLIARAQFFGQPEHNSLPQHFASIAPFSHLFLPLFAISYLHVMFGNLAVNKDQVYLDSVALRLCVRSKPLEVYMSKLTPMTFKTKDELDQLIMLNLEARQLASKAKFWAKTTCPTDLKIGKGRHNVLVEINFFNMLSHLIETGICVLPLGAVTYYSSYQFGEKYFALVGASVNQGLMDTFARVSGSADKLDDTLDSVKNAADSAKNLTDKAAEVAENLSTTASETRNVLSDFKALLSTVTDYIKSFANASDIFRSKVQNMIDSITMMWNWIIEYTDVILPLLLPVLYYILRYLLPAPVFTIVKTAFLVIGSFVYVRSAHQIYGKILDMLENWAGSDLGAEAFEALDVIGTPRERAPATPPLFTKKTVRDPKNSEHDLRDEMLKRFFGTTKVNFEKPENTGEENEIPMFATISEVDDEEFPPSVNQDAADIVEVVAALYCATGVDYTKKKELVQMLKDIPNVSKGGQALYNAIFKVVYWIAENSTQYTGMPNPIARLCDDQFADWMSACSKYVSEEKASVVDTTDIGIKELEAVLQKGINLATLYKANSQLVLHQLVMKAVVELQKVHSKALATRIMEPKKRPVPVCCAFVGPPGTGKTMAADAIAKIVVMHHLKNSPELLKRFAEKESDFITVLSNEKWQEGYNVNTIVNIHEEFPAMRETTPDDSPFSSFLDEINDTAKPLPMANAEQKGKMFWNHKYSFITTNSTHFRSEIMRSQVAIADRIHLVVMVKPKDGLSLRGSNKTFDPDHYEMTAGYVKKDGSNTIVDTHVSISLHYLSHFLIALAENREHKQKVDTASIGAVAEKFMVDYAANPLVKYCFNAYLINHRKTPSIDELKEFIIGNYSELNEKFDLVKLGFEPKGKEHEIRRPSFNVYNPLAEVSEQRQGNASVNQAFGDPVINKVYSAADYFRDLVTSQSDAAALYRLEALGQYLELCVSTGETREDTSSLSSQVIGGSFSTDIKLPTKEDASFHYKVNIGAKLAYLMAESGYYASAEKDLTIIYSLGKFSLFGVPMPMLEGTLANTFIFSGPNPYNPEKTDTVMASFETMVVPITLLSRTLLNILRGLGYSELCGVETNYAVTAYFSLTAFTVECFVAATQLPLQIGKFLFNLIKDLSDIVSKLLEGECSIKDVATLLAQRFKITIESTLSGALERCKEAYESFVGKLKRTAIYFVYHMRRLAVPIIMMFATMATSWYLPSYLFKAFFPTYSQESGAKLPKWHKSSRKPNYAKPGTTNVQDRSVAWIENIVPKIRKNTYECLTTMGNVMGFITALEKRRFMSPSHFLVTRANNTVEGEVFLRLRNCETSALYEVYEKEISIVHDMHDEGKDYVIFDVNNNSIPLHADIKKHFANPTVTRSKLMSGLNSVTLVSFNKKLQRMSRANVNYYDFGSATVSDDTKLLAELPVVGHPIRLDCIDYDIPTVSGECGSLVFMGDKIIGFHAHGNGFRGQASLVDILTLEHSYSSSPTAKNCGVEDLEFEPFEYDKSNMVLTQGLSLDNRDSALLVPFHPPVSVYVKSDFERWNPTGPIQPTVYPVDVHPGKMGPARAKYGPVETELDQVKFDYALETYKKFVLKPEAEGCVRKVYSLKEVITGVPGELPPLDHTTSPGYPLNQNALGRKAIYDISPEGKFSWGPDIEGFTLYLKSCVKSLSDSHIPCFPYKDALKCELRPFEKVEKPRMISGAPLAQTVLFKAYYGAFLTYLNRTSLNSDRFIGLDPHQDWDHMERKFQFVGNGQRDRVGDYGSFDSHTSPDFVEAIATIANAYYGDTNDSPTGRVRRSLARSTVVQYHLFGNIVDLWLGGFASGSYVTADFNSQRNTIMELYSCAVTAENLGKDWKHELDNFFQSGCFIKTMGDDMRAAMSKHYEYHSNVTHAEVVTKAFGVTYTSADKVSSLVPFDDSDKLTFVKRSAVYHDDQDKYYGALDVNTIKNMVCYTKGEDRVNNIHNRADNAIRELSFHSQEIWDEVFPLILKQVGPTYRPPGFDRKEVRNRSIVSWNQSSQNLLNTSINCLLPENPHAPTVCQSGSERMATQNEVVPSQSAGTMISTPTNDSTQNPTTKFADDSVGYEAEFANLSPSEPFSSLIVSPNSQTIVHFLERPSVIKTGSLASTDVGILYQADITALITPQKFARISNIYTWKSDFEVTLMINADRFQQGRYILFYLPTGGASPPGINGNVVAWRNMHTANLMQISQLPHVEIDLATQTHATLKIPYVSVFPMNTWSTINSTVGNGLGIFGIATYSPLNPGTGGSTTCGYTVFGSLTNVKIGSATFNQSAGDKEARAMGVGPVSSVLNKVALSSSVFADVPLIGSYARSVSWFSKLMAKSAAVWGYSKPMALAAPTRVDRKVATFDASSDVAHYSKPLSVSSENSVIFPSSVPVDVDEMDLSFIASHYSYYTALTWDYTQGNGYVVGTFGVQPNVSVAWSKGSTHTPLSFVANQFAKWRGGIRYRFKLVKTAFHRGRLAIAYFPGSLTAGGSLDNSEYVYREIVDVSTTSEFEVCCPYLLTTPWSSTFDSMGVVQVYVVDPLVAPATVSTSVQLLVETSAMEDMMFAAPISWKVEPYAPSTAQSAVDPFEQTPCFTLGPTTRKPAYNLCAETSGEVVKSARQLLKRNWNFARLSPAVGGGNAIEIFPYVVSQVTQGATTGGALFRDYFACDAIDLWSQAFAISYGALRYSFKPGGGFNAAGVPISNLEVSAQSGSTTTSVVKTIASTYTNSGYGSINSQTIEGPVQVQVPNWNTTVGRSTVTHMVNKAVAPVLSEPRVNSTSLLIGDSQALYGYALPISRAAAEDFGLAVFVGVPAVVSLTAT